MIRYEADKSDTPKTLNANEARQAEPRHNVRYVLAISLALVVVLFAILFLSYQ